MKNVAIITARGGSKRIPRKNIKDFLGKPIIAYSIEAALKSGLFDDVMVSTDDEEIAEIAKNFGASVPFMRSAKNSDDFSGTTDVIIEVIEQLSSIGLVYENGCCIYPTAPFITNDSLQSSYEVMIKNNFDTVFPVCQFSFPILRSLQIDENQRVSMIWPENRKIRSQDMKPCYHDAGQFYWFNIKSLIKDKKLYSDNSGTIILTEMEVQDIDNEMDWKLAELKYKLNKNLPNG